MPRGKFIGLLHLFVLVKITFFLERESSSSDEAQ